MNDKLSVIIPSAHEWPLGVFTARNIYEELRGRCDFEILYVDNSLAVDNKSCRSYEQLKAVQRGFPEIKALQYNDTLSHWQAKNLAIKHSNGNILWFCDAHCVVSRNALFNMYEHYRTNHEELNGTLHLPLTYHIFEYHKLVYKLAGDIDKGEVHYSFTPYRPVGKTYQVPCMSSCGMMMTRGLYEDLGGWPAELGIYGGGENFLNFCLATMGKNINIMCENPLCHHGDKRGYSWNFDNHLRNKMIATYCFGGKEFVELFAKHSKGGEDQKRVILNSVINNESCKAHRALIKSQQVISIQDWWAKYRG